MCSFFPFRIILILQILQPLVLPQPPPPIESCNDPLILAHQDSFSHSYCFHTCGFLRATLNSTSSPVGQFFQSLNNGEPFGDSADAYCHSDGYCVCQPACPLSSPRLQSTPDPALCPLDNSVSSNPLLLSSCQARCQTQCGITVANDPRICREVALLGPGTDTETNICTCSCSESIFSCFDLQELLRRLSNGVWGLKLFKFKVVLAKLWKKVVRICIFLLKVKLVKFYFLKLIGFLLTWAGLLEIVSRGVWGGWEANGWGKDVGYY